DFRETIVNALEDVLVNTDVPPTSEFAEVRASVPDDDEGFVQGLQPMDGAVTFTDVDIDSDPPPLFRFDLQLDGVVTQTAEDQVYTFDLVLIGDDDHQVGSLGIEVLVPATDATTDNSGGE
ncbi:MAG: hypothetical protein ACPGTU_18050, partial [Myxococcota bacterium]